MAVLMERPVDATEVSECVIDLENMTWTCTEHSETMRIADESECPKCSSEYPDYLADNWTG